MELPHLLLLHENNISFTSILMFECSLRDGHIQSSTHGSCKTRKYVANHGNAYHNLLLSGEFEHHETAVQKKI